MKFLERKKWLYIPRSQISGRFPLVLRNILRKLQNGLFVNQAKRRGLKLGEMLLDEQQVEAVVACEDAQLVLASAGSGKTMSLLAKIEYLHRELDIPAEKILAISFTKKTVEELIERCSVKNVEFRTFHALGNSILQEYQSEYLAKRRLISESQILEFLRTRLLELCKDAEFARMVNDYVLFYYSTPVAPGGFNNYSQKIRLNRLYLRSTILAEKMKRDYDAISKNHRATALSGEQVRNKEEELLVFLGGLGGSVGHLVIALGLGATGDLQVGVALGGSGASGQQQSHQQQANNSLHCFILRYLVASS